MRSAAQCSPSGRLSRRTQRPDLITSSESVAMAVILISWELGSDLGHLKPLSLVVRRLCEGGHRVILASRELAQVDILYGDCGIDYLQAPFSHGSSANQVQRIRTYAQILQTH